MASGPPTPPKTPEELHFEPQPMVAWFAPSELTRAGIKALLSSMFGAYADYREVQAALREQQVVDYSGEEEIWIDYIADVGDGFGSTYTMARLLAEKKLDLTDPKGQVHSTEKGRLLVFGGDQVYPTANRDEYQNRLVGPYRAAFPWGPEEEAPHVYAVPGNHDWYDGLTSFTRLFCQGRWIGGWKTRQTRSYFALKLHHGWWLWGIDVQLESDVDEPQLQFFDKVAGQQMEPHSKIILCVAEPSWVYTATKGEETYRNVAHFQQRCIVKHGHSVEVGLAGDLHTYARYQRQGRTEQVFVAGGGGAYLYPTHDLPKKLVLPVPPDRHLDYQLEKVHPPEGKSRWKTLGALLFPIKNWKFSLLLSGIYLFYSWVWQSASIGKGAEGSLLEKLAGFRPSGGTGFNEVVKEFAAAIAHSPGSIMLLALLVIGLIAFAQMKSTFGKILLGLTHAAAHLVVILGWMWVFALINLSEWGLEWNVDATEQVILFGAEMLVVGGAAGGLVMGVYLVLSNLLLRTHTNEVYSCQSLPGYKNFLRLHLSRDGKLTIYPVGVDKVIRWRKFRGRCGWRLRPDAQPGEAWIEPADGPITEYAKLIEPPVVL
ncbi:MAG TPA: metallophosphoesterase [Thermoanaerobaculia bacterium]|nr:metallophosphoesterase [Thermoanaerobaculia bacterium]